RGRAALLRNETITSRRSLWDADHILPVAEGSGQCDLDNLRTLCVACHREATEKAEHAIQQIFFIEAGVGSMTATLSDGAEVEVGLFGYESVIGISAFMGVRRSLNGVYMRMSGAGYASAVDDAEAEFRRGEEFQRLALRCVQMQLTQATQSAACYAQHDVGQRMARWLLLCADRAGTTELVFSQDFLAMMLGVQRTSIAIAMGRLKRNGVIDYSRSYIHLLKIPELETEACECYRLLKNHLNNYLRFDIGFAV
ncbi:MAG: helix-turn-helix domain-containing protein, partial [Janthinobacterium lividum]